MTQHAAWRIGVVVAACVVGAGLLPGVAHAERKNDETTSEINDTSRVIDLSGVWFFHAGDNPSFARSSADDRTWTPQRIPTDHTAWSKRWKGFGWYRRHVYVGPRAMGTELMLSLGPAREAVEVYMNGTLIMQRGQFGSRFYGEARVLPLYGIIPNGVLKQGENILAVRVYDPSYSSGLPAGPLLLGEPHAVRERIAQAGQAAYLVRLSLAMVALCIAFSLLIIHGGHASPAGEHWWGAGAGISLALVHLAGTGVLTSTLPSMDLALRLSVAAQPFAVLCMASFFAARYDDVGMRRVRLGRLLLLVIAAVAFLAPEEWVFRSIDSVSLLCALVVTLYGAHMLAQGARRQEPGSLPVFATLIALMALIVYDGLIPPASDIMPAMTSIGAVAVLAVASLMASRQLHNEHAQTLATMVRMRKELDGRVWMDILQASASAISRPQEFLDAVTHEIAREMEVRRCSLVLPDVHGNLYIAACIGLPTQARRSSINAGQSVARWVFDRGLPVTSETLPEELQKPASETPRHTYDTTAFIAHPIKMGEQVLGVLSVTDRNKGGNFLPADDVHVGAVATHLGLVLDRLNLKVDALLTAPPAPGPLLHAHEPEAEARPVPAAPADEAAPPLTHKALS